MGTRVSLSRRLTLWRLPARAPLILFALLTIASGVIWFAFTRTADRLVDSLRWFGQVEFASRSVGWSGDVHLRGLRLSTYAANPQRILDAEEVVIDTQSFLWSMLTAFEPARNAAIEAYFPRSRIERIGAGAELPKALPEMRTLVVEARGVVAGPALQSFGELRWFGLASASPFDARGCGPEHGFDASELLRMGLPDEPLRVRLSMAKVDATTADVAFTFARAGASRATLSMRLRADNPERLIDADFSTLIALERRWEIVDEGFVAARNRYCASRLGTSRDQYVDRHVNGVRTHLAALGVRAEPALESAYRRFAGRGGELIWRAQPTLATTFGQMARFSPEQQLRLLNATVETVRGRTVPFVLHFEVVAPAPTAAVASADNASSATQSEDTAPSAAAAPAPDGPAAPAPERAGATVAADDRGALPPSVPQPPPLAATPSVPTTAASAPAPAANVAPPVAPATVDATGVGTIAEPTLRRSPYAPGQIVPYEALADMVGRRFEILSIYGTRRRGTLEKYTNAALTIRLGTRENGLRLTMPHRTVREIRLLDQFAEDSRSRANAG